MPELPREDDGPRDAVSLDVVRRLALVNARISTGSVLSETLQAVADGIVSVLGFGVAVVNHRLPSGDLAAVAIAGGDDVREALADAVYPRALFEDSLRRAECWGALRFISHAQQDDSLVEWVPDIPVSDAPERWHPLDMLLAPLHADDGEMVGVISVDLPPGGLRPSRTLCELLELFAMQSGIAIAAVEMRQRFQEERSAREWLLRDLASRDALTGLPNRRAMTEALRAAVLGARRSGRPGAVLFCDVDGLKALNDQQGHARGDDALKAWGAEMVSRVRSGDIVCRVGGDEFVVIADQLARADAEHLAVRLREPPTTGASDLAGLTLSVGMAVVDGETAPEELLALADQAMYADKVERRRASD